MAQQQALSGGEQRFLGNIAARLDRLPLTRRHWELALLVQLAWAGAGATDGIAARLYPFIWEPAESITNFEYSTLYAFQVGISIVIGDFFIGLFADRYGRRPAIILSTFLAGMFIWPFVLTTNFWWLLLFSILGTLGFGGMLATNVVYIAELVAPDQRGRLTMAAQTFAFILLAVLAAVLPFYWIPSHWHAYLWVLAGIELLVVLPLLVWRLPESPRWLEAHDRGDEAERQVDRLEQSAAASGATVEPVELSEHTVVAVTDEHVPITELLRGEYARRTILLFFAWVLGYGGIIYGVGAYALVYVADRGFGSHFTFGMYAAGVVVGGVLTFLNSFYGERIERRVTALLGALAFVFGWAIIYLTDTSSGPALTILYLISASGAVVWIVNMYGYTANAFPTRLRGTGTGWADGVGHLGAWGGVVLAGYLFDVGPNHLGWILMITVPGALAPALLIYFWGLNQRGAVLEQLST
jgi:putative MFS transporter